MIKSHDRVMVENAVELLTELRYQILPNISVPEKDIYQWVRDNEDNILETIVGLEGLLERKSKLYNGNFL